MGNTGSQSTHWADIHADKIVRDRGPLTPTKSHFTCASGITPSGTVHIGNFREIISVDLVVRALKDKGVPVRFIYSWDDYDVFRKVPKNLPDPDTFRQYLRLPITRVPDPWDEYDSYARAHEKRLEEVLPTLGIAPEYIYQTERYTASHYAKGIRVALEHRDTIRGILNEFRSEPLPAEWWPVSVFSRFTGRDSTTVLSWDGEWGLTYRCDDSGREETVDLRSADCVKLPWRVDWPMRWKEEGVDFEPAGKEHHSAGGSFDTARRIVESVYGGSAPVTFKYDFISIKGMGGKISSSLGNVIDLNDVLAVYQPEIVRYLFAGTRPNAEFAISFDLDVIKIYEDYDRCERVYYGLDEVGEKKRAKESRIYELSQTGDVAKEAPVQIPFRHLCNVLLITAGDIDAALARFGDFTEEDLKRHRVRAACAWNWTQNHAPEDFRFSLRSSSDDPVDIDDAALVCVRRLAEELEANFDDHDEKSLQEFIYASARENGLEPADFFTAMYQVLVEKEKGPRLSGFLITLGRDTVLDILKPYRKG
ncbi:MAG: lysine--tRNA ligase [Spirochaetaceae bacterium]|nr:MAG: lysine--tRNA ligase [Spirochaetaceae bacterium]